MSSRPALSRRPRARLVLLTVLTLAGLATVPTEGADRHLERPKPRVALQAAERWRLRPTESVVTVTGSVRRRPETAIPEDRRNVRLVYPALVEAR
ncbi:hypothetical protein MCBMB27_04797 [Methylobacterium phyllosphaerae]|uniref:Uncharacterized protein n=1 Tax=Methylobacterium phyllosphaerae TaxID=418223 RepID=A0AAE8HSE8_9HYPH|nr:hypothetical protein [Methylobacterium phyllosphaerae]APT34088.1 hypothetical protein MCBMB27_04797 [Methylobacterium phyllosphaerae]SFG98757.1 hypothetical protein SAMN05192567_111153 [Methylobacterium phyllosphaerae]